MISKCRFISNKDLEVMSKLINLHKEMNREHGALLCQKDNKIMISGSCIGSKCGISFEFGGLSCPEQTKEIGEFHTHTGGNNYSRYPSSGDIKFSK